MFGSQKIPVYCHMGNFGCGAGGWTLAMKTDGKKVSDCPSSHQSRFFANRIEIYFRHLLQSTPLPTYTDLVLRAFFCGHARAANSLVFCFHFCFYFRKPFIMIRPYGATKTPTTSQEGRLGLTLKRPNYRPTGTRLSPKSASV